MKITKRMRQNILVLMMSILLCSVANLRAETDEPGPFERLFHAMRRAFNEPQHRSAHRRSHKHIDETTNSPSERSNAQTATQTTTQTATGGVSVPPSEGNTRSATRATGKKQNGLAYGNPVPGKTGLVTSPYSPEGGYIDVRGFAPGTPVKDPYSGKIFLTP